MGELAIRRPNTALSLLSQIVLPDAKEGDEIELVIHARGNDVSIRDMAAYLELADHLFGRLHPDGYRSYAMRPAEHVRIEEIRGGSVVITIAGLISAASPYLIAQLCLKYLPDVFQKTAAAYDHLQQGILAREKRKQLRRHMEQDPQLSQLPTERRNELVALVDSLLESDGELLVRAKRYADEYVLDIHVRLKQ